MLSCLAALVATAPAVASRTDCTPEAGWPAQNASLAQQVVALVNQRRASLGLSQLTTSQALTNAAAWKAAQLAVDVAAYGAGAFAHEDYDPATGTLGRTPPARLQACGWGYNFGENIAYGQPTAERVMAAWVGSEGHRRNLDSPGWVSIGVGAVQGPDGIGWVQEFGDQIPDPIPTPTASLVAPTPAPTTPTIVVPLAPPIETPPAEAASVAALGLQIMARPRSRTRRRTARIRWAVSGVASQITCSLNGKTLQRCGMSGRTLRVRRGRRHVFQVTVSGPNGTATQMIRWRVLRRLSRR